MMAQGCVPCAFECTAPSFRYFIPLMACCRHSFVPKGNFCHETSCQSRLSWGYDDGGVYGVVIYPNNILGCDFHCTSILSNISWRCLPTSPGVFRVPCEEAYCIGREFIVVPKTVPPSRLPPAAVPQSISCDCCAKCRSLGQSARNRFPEGGPQSRTVVLW